MTVQTRLDQIRERAKRMSVGTRLLGETGLKLVHEDIPALLAIAEAAESLLDYTERKHGGDQELTSEDYYVARDTMRAALSGLGDEDG